MCIIRRNNQNSKLTNYFYRLKQKKRFAKHEATINMLYGWREIGFTTRKNEDLRFVELNYQINN